MTMPGPPPHGESSTVLCLSCVHLRRSWTRMSRMPCCAALPISETSSGARYSGKMLTMSMRTTASLDAVEVEQALGQGDDHPAALDVHDRNEPLEERDQHLGGVGALHREDVLARQVQQVGDLAEDRAALVDDGEAEELVVVELLRVVRGLVRIGIDDQDHVAQRLGGVAVGDAFEGEEEPA